jgi:membrane protease YdiL (CAAX protease family)
MRGDISSDSSDCRRSLWIETGAVLLLIGTPTLAWIACKLLWGSDYLQLDRNILELENGTLTAFGIHRMESIFSNMRLVPIILFIIWRSGDEWSQFGLIKPKWEIDILIGLCLFLIIGVVYEINWAINIPFRHLTWWRLSPAFIPIDRAVLLIASAFSTGFSEELIARGYLIPRFETLIGSTWKSILFSAIVFGVLHIYKSLGSAIMSCLSGVIWGIGFCATRRIWPVVISHAMWDFAVAAHINAFIPT